MHSIQTQTPQQSLDKELENLQVEHQQLVEENEKLKQQLEQILHGPEPDLDVRIIPVLKEQLAEKQNKGEKTEDVEKLKSQLSHSENIISLLKRQLDLNSRSDDHNFNPELIVQMANEIERLKEEFAGSTASTESLTKKPRPHSATSERSRIPRLARSNSAGSAQNLAGLTLTDRQLRDQLGDAKVK